MKHLSGALANDVARCNRKGAMWKACLACVCSRARRLWRAATPVRRSAHTRTYGVRRDPGCSTWSLT
eukprot:366301-Chlamydomonas_euryale.AAC.4